MTRMTSKRAVEERYAEIAHTDVDPRESAALMRQSALWYAENGIPVFPLMRGSKVPQLRSPHPGGTRCKGECGEPGHGYHDATTDIATVDQWWSVWPHCNIGTPTGVVFDVLDVDGEAGYESLSKIIEHGMLPDRTYGSIRTPNKAGVHILLPPSGDGRCVSLMPGIDGLGRDGHSLLPPSYIVDGKRGFVGTYCWLEEYDLEGLRRDTG